MSTRQPNILLIFVDNQPASMMGCYGNDEIFSPHLDELASKGVLFRNAFCPNSMCSPCRASMLTGLMPSQHGIHTWLDDYLMDTWPEGYNAIAEFETLPEKLTKKGYHTAMIGKYHLGFADEPQNGFKHWVAMEKGTMESFYDVPMIDNGQRHTAPEHSTLTKFRKRLMERGKLAAFEELLTEMFNIALESGVQFGSIQIVDSVHSVANVNTSKDETRKKKGKGPRDPDAKWGVKHTRKVKDEHGNPKEQREYFYGYKAYVSLNAESGMITNLVVTPGNAYDGHKLPELVNRDMELGLPIDTVAADRGYDDGNNHYFLEQRGLHSAIHLNTYRTQKNA